MERNQLIGTVLLVVLITIYFQFFGPKPPERLPNEVNQDSISNVQQLTPRKELSSSSVEVSHTLDSLAKLKYGVFSSGMTGESRIIKFENEDLRLEFDSKGGFVKKVVLKKHVDFKKNPLVLLDEESSKMDFSFTTNNEKIYFSDLSFNSIENKIGDTTTIQFHLALEGDRSITQQYKIPSKGYQVKYSVDFEGLEGYIPTQLVNFNWRNDLRRVESDLVDSRNKTTVRYYLSEEGTDNLSPTSMDLEEENLEAPVKWVSFKQKFFNSGIIAEKTFRSGYVSAEADEYDTDYVKRASAKMLIQSDDLHEGANFKFYFGPNNYRKLVDVTDDYSDNINMGWFLIKPINKFFILPIFELLESFIPSYGVIIMLMVLIIRLVLAPLTFRSHISMAKMKVLKPEMDEISAEHGDDMQKKQAATMKLYQSMGINPLSGCIPMLLQMPILFSMFYFFPAAIQLRQQSWLWAHDLSTYDSILNLPVSIPFYGDHVSLFTLLMTASTILSIWSNSQMSTQVQGPMKTVQYVMPITFLFFLNGYSSGLTFYYFVSNVISYAQMFLFKRFIDEGKIREKLEQNRQKNSTKKKGKFAQRLEEAMKANQELQKKKKR